jgi:N-carbamoyl-L-amino-acid hydrolase
VTFGDISVYPGVRNTVPGRVTISLDLRHHDMAILDRMDSNLRAMVAQHSALAQIQSSVKGIWSLPVTQFDPACIAAVQKASDQLGCRSMEMVSGAGHDSLHVASVAPTAMIFVPCENGLSHNEAENASPADLEAGCNVLLHAMISMAGIQV